MHYHRNLERKYKQAAGTPWAFVAADPPPPRDPTQVDEIVRDFLRGSAKTADPASEFKGLGR
jgi:hypothetical protein